MINRTFNDYKFKRTYLGGSEKSERLILDSTQGSSEKNYEDCNWFDFRRHLNYHYDDKLNVIFSWRMVFNNIRYILAIIAFILLFSFFKLSIIVFFISIICHVIYIILKTKQVKTLKEYDFCSSIINDEIKKKTGIKLSKNY
jgi:hypothetical protein